MSSTSSSALMTWALPQLSRVLPLDDDSLQQLITYADTLPKATAAEHLKGLLGDSPQALEFITSFNSRRQSAAPTSSSAAAAAATSHGANGGDDGAPPRRAARGPKKKANIHSLPPRQIENYGNVQGAYLKRDEDEYMAGGSGGRSGSSTRSSSTQKKQQQQQQQQQRESRPAVANQLALREKPDAVQAPTTRQSQGQRAQAPPPPSASGRLISDLLPSNPGSKTSSRTSSPAPAKTKIAISGGTNMHGAASTLSDLDSAIKSLEVQTNPTLASQAQTPAELAKRRCKCMATRHPLLAIAPNCLACGKIICVKEGLGPCTFCGTPLLSPQEIDSMVRVLKDERGAARQAANNATHRRAEVSAKPRAFTGRDFLSSAHASASPSPLASAAASEDEGADGKLDKAKEHRDKLLAFQANNAKRTRIHDEAADFDIPVSGTNMWASPTERAAQLKKQQKALREMEWNARPEWEKRKVVASIDVVGGKIVKRMAEVERPPSEDEAESEDGDDHVAPEPEGGKGGAFSHNPLMGSLIRPVAKADKGKGKNGDADGQRTRQSTWRRVQDDNDDNEQWILDGGVYGGDTEGRVLGAEEHASG